MKNMKNTKSVTITVRAIKDQYRWSETNPEFILVTNTDDEYHSPGSFIVGKLTVDIPLSWPDNTVAAQVESFMEAKEVVRRVYQDKDREFDDQIQSLLALPAPK